MSETVDSSFSYANALPLVGREPEVAALRNALDQALGGRGGLVLISGEAGIGKTSLIREFVHTAQESEALILTGAAYDFSATPPYGPWLDISDTFPESPELPGLPDELRRGTGIGDLQDQQALFDLARRFFIDVSRVTPLVIILEDLHWSDRASLDMLRHVARHIEHHPILVIGTYRDDEVARDDPLFQLLPALVRESQSLRIKLGALDRADLQELVRARWKLEKRDEQRLIDFLLRHAEGHPLFTVETLGTLEQSDLLHQTETGIVLGDLSSVPVPGLVKQVIERRLAQFGARDRELLEIGAVIGHRVPLDVLETVAGPNLNDAGDLIDRAVELSVLENSGDPRSVQFSHALIREVLCEGMPPSRRWKLHEAVGEILEAETKPDADQVAHHFRQAAHPRAIDWLIRAGEHAERTFAWQEAFARHNEAVRILRETGSDDPLLARLLLKLGRLLRFTDTRRGIEFHEQSREIALQSGDDAIADLALFNNGSQHCMTGDLWDGIRYMEQAVQGIVENANAVRATSRWSQTALVAPVDPVFSSIGTLVAQLSYAGRYEDVIRTTDKYLPADWRDGRGVLEGDDARDWVLGFADGFWGLGIAHSALGNVDDSRLAFDIIRTLLKRLNYHGHYLFVTSSYLTMHHFAYQTTMLVERREITRSIESRTRSGSGSAGRRNMTWGLEWVLLHEGRWDEWQKLVIEQDEPELAVFWNTAMCARARLSWYRGDRAKAWNLIDRMVPDGPDDGSDLQMQFLQREPHRVAAAMAIEDGHLERARQWIDAHDAWLAWSGAVLGRADGLLLRARLAAAESDPGSAFKLAQQARDAALDPRQPLALIGIDRFLGQLALRSGDLEQAEFYLNHSLELTESAAMPFERARTLLALAELAQRHRDSRAAHSYIADVRRICHELGAQPLLDRANRLARRIGSPDDDLPLGLTRREFEVLQLLAQGKSDKAIADDLYISHFTVMRHVSSILRKLDVDSRTTATAEALRQNLV